MPSPRNHPHPNPNPNTRTTGAAAERAAARWLERNGYRILERNYRTKPGEIDVIARDADTLCFLEIKARTGPRFGPAVAAVTPAKQRTIARVAALYLIHTGWQGPCRFDVLGLERRPDGTWHYHLVRDAFTA